MVNRLISSSVDRTKRALRAFAKFLQGALGLAVHGSRDTGHGPRISYAQHLAHKYSQPNRCC